MQITVFGANGNIGQRVVRLLLTEGHHVVAFVHRHADLPAHENLSVIKGDIHHQEDIQQALSGSGAVISALGSWHTQEKNILSSAMELLIPAMRDTHIQRIITVTGAGAIAPGDSPSIFDTFQHTFFNAVAPRILRDGEEHIRLLSESTLDWTVIRSPVMNDIGPHDYKLVTPTPLPWQTVHRDAVAQCLVDQLKDASHYAKAPFIARN